MLHTSYIEHPSHQPTNPALALFDREVRRLSTERAALSAQLIVLVESAQRMVGDGAVSLVPADHDHVLQGASMLDHLRADGVLTLTMGSHTTATTIPPPSKENVAPNHQHHPQQYPTNTKVHQPDVVLKPVAAQGVIKMTSTRPAVVQTLHRVSRPPKAELSPTKPTPPTPTTVTQQEQQQQPTPTTSRPQGIVLLPARDLRRSTSRATTPEVADHQQPSPPPTPTNAPQPQPRLPLHPTTSNTSNSQRRPSQAPIPSSQPASRGSSTARELRTFDVEDSKPVIEAPPGRGTFTEDCDEDTLHLLYGRPTSRAIRFGEAPTTRSSQQPTPKTSRPSSRAPSPSPVAVVPTNVDDALQHQEAEREVPTQSVPLPTSSRTASPFIACRSRASSEEAPYNNNPTAATSGGGLVFVRRQSSPVRQPPTPTPAVAAGREWMFPTSAGRPRLT